MFSQVNHASAFFHFFIGITLYHHVINEKNEVDKIRTSYTIILIIPCMINSTGGSMMIPIHEKKEQWIVDREKKRRHVMHVFNEKNEVVKRDIMLTTHYYL